MGEKIESVELVDGDLIVTKRQASGVMLMTNPPRSAPDRVWREVYSVVDGKIAIAAVQEGKVIPATPERVEFAPWK